MHFNFFIVNEKYIYLSSKLEYVTHQSLHIGEYVVVFTLPYCHVNLILFEAQAKVSLFFLFLFQFLNS